MWRINTLILTLLVGCTSLVGPDPSRDGRLTTRFDAYPAPLFAAFQAACARPGDQVVRAGRNKIECRSLLPPEPTAALILHFDGTIEALPQLIVSLSGAQHQARYLLETQYYVVVPQKDGGELQVRQGNRGIENDLNELLRAAGGTPVTVAPQAREKS